METSTDTPPVADAQRTGPTVPAWLVELLEVLELRRRTLLLSIGGVALVGLLTALFLPRFLPPRPVVGAAVGLAAVLLGVAITFGLDSLDLKIRGPRHVRSSGGLLAQQLVGPPSPEPLGRLVAAVGARARGDGRVLIGLSPVDFELEAEGWQDALAEALADDGLRVLTVDLQRPPESHPGVVEVAEGRSSLADAVTFDDERMVARLGPGGDPAAALGGIRTVIDRLPSDIDVLVVLLPPPNGGGVLGAASALDHVYVLAEVDRTTRVDLIAALDAFDAVQATSEVLLITAPGEASTDPEPASETVPAVPPAVDLEPVVEEPAAEEPAAEALAPEVVDEPVEEPAEEAVAEEPAEELVVDEPADVAPVDVAPVDVEPVDVEPVDEEPALEEPALPPSPDPLPAPEPVLDGAPEDDSQLRLVMAEAALQLSDVGAIDLLDDAADDEAFDEGDPTVETPPVVLDEPDVYEDEPVAEPEPAPEPASVAAAPAAVEAPFADQQDLPEDPERVAAALRFLGQEPWSPRVPAAPRG